MKCFTHHDHDAIGICKCCGKSVCKNCFIELKGEHALVCSYDCADALKSLLTVPLAMEINQMSQKKSYKVINQPYLFLTFGLLLIINSLFNFYLIKADYSIESFLIGIAVIFTLLGILGYKQLKALF